MIRRLALAALLALSACAAEPPAPAPPSLLLISLDGFRPDYLDRGITPALSALARNGVRAAAMQSAFPTITFPNHYTLVTGRDPDHTGIVSNTMEDPADPAHRFSLHDTGAVEDPFWWNAATPLWVSGERQGVRTATMFWPGSTTPIQGTLPWRRRRYDGHVSYDARVDTVLHWLDVPASRRPRFLTLYFEGVDTAGHKHGPDTPEMNTAIADVDRAMARLMDGLRRQRLAGHINIIVVSDHGMAPVPKGHVVRLDRMLPEGSADILPSGPIASIRPHDGMTQTVASVLLAPHPHFRCWARQDIPARLHYGSNPRVLPYFCLAEDGWILDGKHAELEDHAGGAHGYDNADPLMRATFLAQGPAFRPGTTLPQFPNVDVYPLMARLTGIRPEPNQGDDSVFAPVLQP